MFTGNRLGPITQGPHAATIRGRFLAGLFYYAPLSELVEPMATGVQTPAQLYGATSLVRSCLSFEQTSGIKDGFAYAENCGTAFLITASANNPTLRLLGAFNNTKVDAPMSASVWVRVDEVAASGGTLARSQGGTRNYGMAWEANGTMWFNFTVGGVFKSATSPLGAVVQGVWQHWVGTYDQVFIRLYCNGVEVAATAETGVPDNINTPHRIGSIDASGVRSRACAIRHVAVWTGRALSADDVADLYANSGSLFEDSAYGRAIESPETWMPAAAGVVVLGGERKRVLTIGMSPERYAAIGNIDNYPVFGM